jgi:DNA-binding PadR family transcriptional regulator
MIVQKQPMNGAEIMDSMESGSRGWWRPSPGSVYPMLQRLTEEGLLKKRADDGRYEITPQGKEEVEWPSRMRGESPRSVEGVIEEMSHYVSYLEDLAQSKDGKVTANASKIKELSERLARIGGS